MLDPGFLEALNTCSRVAKRPGSYCFPTYVTGTGSNTVATNRLAQFFGTHQFVSKTEQSKNFQCWQGSWELGGMKFGGIE